AQRGLLDRDQLREHARLSPRARRAGGAGREVPAIAQGARCAARDRGDPGRAGRYRQRAQHPRGHRGAIPGFRGRRQGPHAARHPAPLVAAKNAVVLVSGGLDSATVLAIAASGGWRCHALSIDYGQRHRSELDAARRVARALGAHEHRVAAIDLTLFGGSALTDRAIEVPTEPSAGIPVTYVPARNTIFLALAMAYAEVV